ncbi:MAG: hypothetical protein J6P40_04670, partial [Oscillospiraceae bacterium]|nr:hypothetical protein [Oscillospiraceae bacterium]
WNTPLGTDLTEMIRNIGDRLFSAVRTACTYVWEKTVFVFRQPRLIMLLFYCGGHRTLIQLYVLTIRKHH